MPLSNRTCFLVNLRDKLSCKLCGAFPKAQENYHRGFEYHHVQPRALGGSDEPENIALLCHDCHQRCHQQQISELNLMLTLPVLFHCHVCKAALNPKAVEMNCGWYECHHCQQKIHLFTHFFRTASKKSDS